MARQLGMSHLTSTICLSEIALQVLVVLWFEANEIFLDLHT